MSTRIAAILMLAATAAVAAQVPVTQDPRHRVTFENSQFRILDVDIPAGTSSVEHRHDFDVVTVSMTNGTNTRVSSTGQPAQDRQPRPLGDASVAEYTGKPQSHRVENVGKTAYQLFAVENLRKSGWTTTAAITGRGTNMTAESRAFRVYDVRLRTGATQTSHTHEVPTVVILIDGSVLSDGPDAQAKANAPAAVGLKQLTQRGEWILVPRGDRHHLVRLGSGDARVVEVEVR